MVQFWNHLLIEFTSHYLSGQNLLPTELQYCDGFAQLASHLLLEVNYESGIFYNIDNNECGYKFSK